MPIKYTLYIYITLYFEFVLPKSLIQGQTHVGTDPGILTLMDFTIKFNFQRGIHCYSCVSHGGFYSQNMLCFAYFSIFF
jgi:hypothetical protein